MRLKRSEQGDTLIEVLVAVVALSIVVTLAYTIMTRSFAQGQIALERTTTQGMVAAQISMLRDMFARHEQAVRNGAVASSTPWGLMARDEGSGGYVRNVTSVAAIATSITPCQFSTNSRFYFAPTTGTSADIVPIPFIDARRIRQATYPTYGDGLWIEGYKITPPGARPYYDFYVKACWDAAISGERQTVVTNVRFYEVY